MTGEPITQSDSDDGYPPLYRLAHAMAGGNPVQVSAIFALPASVVLNCADYTIYLHHQTKSKP